MKIKRNNDYFFSPITSEKDFKEFGDSVFKIILDFLKDKKEKPVHPGKSEKEIARLFCNVKIPAHGKSITELLAETKEKIVENSVRVGSPFFMGHMTGPTPTFILFCDMLISALNQNTVKLETALSATYVEKQTLIWLHRLVFRQPEKFYHAILENPHQVLGTTCGGGTIGNLTALLAAREFAFPGIREKGIISAYREKNCERAVIIVSERGHYSLKKAALIMGIGEENVITIPCVPYKNQIRQEDLLAKLGELKKEKAKVIAIVGIAGTTETGNIDDLKSLAAIAKEHRTWFHVDAAWGGSLLLSSRQRILLEGIDLADSVVIDGHKSFYLTLSHSLVLFREAKAFETLRHSTNYIIRKESHDLGQTSVEGSRRFDSFKLWFSLSVFGKTGYGKLIDDSVKRSARFSAQADSHPSFEATSLPTTNIFTYRYVSRTMKKALVKARQILSSNRYQERLIHLNGAVFTQQNFCGTLKAINRSLNKINTEVQQTQWKQGNSFVSRTVLESVYPDEDIVVLRAIPFHPRADLSTFVKILTEQERQSDLVFQEELRQILDAYPLAFHFLEM